MKHNWLINSFTVKNTGCQETYTWLQLSTSRALVCGQVSWVRHPVSKHWSVFFSFPKLKNCLCVIFRAMGLPFWISFRCWISFHCWPHSLIQLRGKTDVFMPVGWGRRGLTLGVARVHYYGILQLPCVYIHTCMNMQYLVIVVCAVHFNVM